MANGTVSRHRYHLSKDKVLLDDAEHGAGLAAFRGGENHVALRSTPWTAPPLWFDIAHLGHRHLERLRHPLQIMFAVALDQLAVVGGDEQGLGLGLNGPSPAQAQTEQAVTNQVSLHLADHDMRCSSQRRGIPMRGVVG